MVLRSQRLCYTCCVLQLFIFCILFVIKFAPETTIPDDVPVAKSKFSAQLIKKYAKSQIKPSNNCLKQGIRYSGPLSPNNTWHPVDAKRTAFVFSPVYEDSTQEGHIVVTGVRLLQMEEPKYFCQLWYDTWASGTRHGEIVVAETNLFQENHGRMYSSCTFTCSFPEGRIPVAISIVAGRCVAARNALRVVRPRQQSHRRIFTVCSAPFHFQYDDVYELVSWIELNRILGAERFTVYNYSISSNVDRVLRVYQTQGIMEIVQWQLPAGVREPKEIHYYAQSASLNDCFFRNKQNSEYMVNLDLDEYIIPQMKNVTTWNELLETLPTQNGYRFSNVFFRTDWQPVAKQFYNNGMAKLYRIKPLQYLNREDIVWPVPKRSKYICRSNHTKMMRIHNMDLLNGSDIGYTVPERDALLYHYRNWKSSIDVQTVDVSKIADDLVVDRYSEKLIRSVAKVWSIIGTTRMNVSVSRKWSAVKKNATLF